MTDKAGIDTMENCFFLCQYQLLEACSEPYQTTTMERFAKIILLFCFCFFSQKLRLRCITGFQNRLIVGFYENLNCFVKDYWLETDYWLDPVSPPYFAFADVILLISNQRSARFTSFSPSLT